MTDKKDDKNSRDSGLGPFKYFALVGQIGLVIALPLVLMIWLATFIMDYFDFQSVWLLIIFILMGIYAGFRNAYNLLMKKR